MTTDEVSMLKSDIDSLKDKVETLRAENKEAWEKVWKILSGNGKPGLWSRVDNNEQWINEQKKRANSIWEFAFRAIITALIMYIAYKVGITP